MFAGRSRGQRKNTRAAAVKALRAGAAGRNLSVMVETVISIRPARLGDEVQIARVHDSAWREAYQGVIPGRELERMILRRGPAWWRQAIAAVRG